MNRKIKLIILIIMSLSVYFIYQKNDTHEIKILLLGDSLSQGINSYGIKGYSYLDYWKKYLESEKITVDINEEYSKNDMSIIQALDVINSKAKIKRLLTEAHYVVINLGYNDLLYKLSIEKNLNQTKYNRVLKEIENNYQELIKQIRKYNKNKIIVVGYYSNNSEDYYENIGIRQLNQILYSEENIEYIDTYNLLSNTNQYFLNPNSSYPNEKAYQKIAKQIIEKTLEKENKI